MTVSNGQLSWKMCPNGESEIPDVVAQTLLKLKVAKPRHVAREFGRGWGETERQRGGGGGAFGQ